MIFKIIKPLLYIIVSIYLIFIFISKDRLYYLLEQKLQSKDITISNKHNSNNIFGINLNAGKIYYKDVNIANFDKINFFTLLLYNEIEIDSLSGNGIVANFFPGKISYASIKYNILSPNKISIKANGEFGTANGNFDILSNQISIYIDANKTVENKYKLIFSKMKNIKGVLTYEQKF
jgi:hypothetical protein